MNEDHERRLRALEARLHDFASAGRPLESAGTAFPSSPPTGMRFWRTDIGIYCYYDGTRWLTVEEYPVSLNIGTGITTIQYIYSAVDTAYDIYLTRHVFVHFVATTNDGSNYWTAKLYTYTTTGTLRDTRASNLAAANTWSTNSSSLAIAGSGIRNITYEVDKIGAPGALDGAGLIYYRKIIT